MGPDELPAGSPACVLAYERIWLSAVRVGTAPCRYGWPKVGEYGFVEIGRARSPPPDGGAALGLVGSVGLLGSVVPASAGAEADGATEADGAADGPDADGVALGPHAPVNTAAPTQAPTARNRFMARHPVTRP